MDGFERQVELLSAKISTLIHSNPPPYIHCSKINGFIRQISEVGKALDAVVIDPSKKISKQATKYLTNLHQSLDEFQQLHAQCCHDVCAQLALTVSMRSVKSEIGAIRNNCMRMLESLGFPSICILLGIPPQDFDSQDQVDVKRIAVILNQLQLKPTICKRPEVANHLKNRLASLDHLGISLSEVNETVALPELPSSLKLIVNRDDIECFDVIGRGQSGEVVRGVIKSTKQDVAVKILPSRALSAFEMEMFRREVLTMSTLKHPALVKFCGYTNDQPYYLLTEFMENGCLYDYLHESPEQLTPTDRTLIALDIARGMEYLHGRGIIHRDLKSLNILLDSKKRAKICDFGLIRMKSSDPMTGLVGTSQWMAPEVLQSLPFYDEKVDVYSFGIVLWELLTGKKPYHDGNSETSDPVTFVNDIAENNKRPEIPDTCPENLQKLIESCWQTDPKSRPSFHQIAVMLSDSSFQFPGGKIFVMLQEGEARAHRHSYSETKPMRRMVPTSHAFTKSIQRIVDAMELGHMEHLNDGIMQLKYAADAPNIVWTDAAQELTGIIEKADAKYHAKLVQALLYILRKAKTTDCALIVRLLTNNNQELVSTVESQLLVYPDPVFLGNETIEQTLLGFVSNGSQDIRVKAVALLLATIDACTNHFVSNPNLILRILNFTGRKLPISSLKMLFDSIAKLFKLLPDVPEPIIQKLKKIQNVLPSSVKPSLLRCIEQLLDHPSMQPYLAEFLGNAVTDFAQYQSLFMHWMDIEPKTPEPIIRTLIQLSSDNDEALRILTKLIQKHPFLKPTVVPFLPTNNSNRQMLLNFYTEFFDVPQVLQQMEFLNTIVDLFGTDSYEKVYDFIRKWRESINAKVFNESEIPKTVVSLMEDENEAIPMLKFMFVIECQFDCPVFRKIVPSLFMLLSDRDLSKYAFICLAGMAKFSVEGFDLNQLLEFAAEFVNEESGRIRNASVFLFCTYLKKCSNQDAIINTFLKGAKDRNEYVSHISRVILQSGCFLDGGTRSLLENLL